MSNESSKNDTESNKQPNHPGSRRAEIRSLTKSFPLETWRCMLFSSVPRKDKTCFSITHFARIKDVSPALLNFSLHPHIDSGPYLGQLSRYFLAKFVPVLAFAHCFSTITSRDKMWVWIRSRIYSLTTINTRKRKMHSNLRFIDWLAIDCLIVRYRGNATASRLIAWLICFSQETLMVSGQINYQSLPPCKVTNSDQKLRYDTWKSSACGSTVVANCASFPAEPA